MAVDAVCMVTFSGDNTGMPDRNLALEVCEKRSAGLD